MTSSKVLSAHNPFREALDRLESDSLQAAAPWLGLAVNGPIRPADLVALSGALNRITHGPTHKLTLLAPYRTGILDAVLALVAASEGMLLEIAHDDIARFSPDTGNADFVLVLTGPNEDEFTHASIARAHQLAEAGRPTILLSTLPTGVGPKLANLETLAVDASPPFFDERLSQLGEPYLDPRAANAMAFAAMRGLRALAGRARKLIICDLDGTLWRGVLGEDGVQGARRPNDAFDRLQLRIQQLEQDHGALLAIATRNDRELVNEAFRYHNDMPLQLSSFSAVQAGWSHKADMIVELLDTLAVAPSHALFLDDNPVERVTVAERLPGLLVPEWAEDPNRLEAYLGRTQPTYGGTRSSEDDLRRDSTRARHQAELALARGRGLDSLQMQATLLRGDQIPSARVAQMFRRVTQFNATGVSQERIMEHPGAELLAIRLRDRYADHGVIALSAGHLDGESWVIDAFLVSCRALERGVETLLLHESVLLGQAQGASKICADIRFTARNTPVRTLYSDHGFYLVSQSAQGSQWAADPEVLETMWASLAIRVDHETRD